MANQQKKRKEKREEKRREEKRKLKVANPVTHLQRQQCRALYSWCQTG